ncbi:copper oxidase [Rhodococcus sp. ACS1]|uniref:Multicopper oxidase with three cupredoxin domains (Includes cell division protein FtsP and spore coat protein CotA) n=1 Tax=Rhodococcus koreensis TaxID=99653 RepID=A0A1H5ETE6_9NOCA|nr:MULTISPECIES: multicopper oxidase family protein [Rhodococcus]PBC40108.1 copper oxidase [Rhodococcus sp. ACS1]SED94274.1 Multicopper oxidase with three cupredoxin domains (includes cell division protein FtsP and spore coat protein CotA) [Rhodococcus koreensis]
MEPISRRRALQLGGLGLAGVLTGALGLVWQGSRGTRFDAAAGAELSEPSVLSSTGGELALALEAAEGNLPVAGGRAGVLGFNGGVPGPTLRIRPGDRLRVTLRNRLTEPTNLHLHGLHVSPAGNGDNPFLRIEPGQDFDYEYRLPDTHPPGVYWYHPHHHGLVADQIFGGLYGAIIVDDTEPMPVTRERVLVISDLTLDGAGRIAPVSMMDRMLGREGNLVLVNGQHRPTITAAPGTRERWRIVNACVSRYLRLRLDGQQLQLLGLDSGRFTAPRPVEEIVLAGGNRADLVVSTTPGSAQLLTLPIDRGAMDMMGMGNADMRDNPPRGQDATETILAALEISGIAGPQPAPLPPQPTPRDLRGETVAATATFTLDVGMGMGVGMGAGGMRFTIDGREFDPDRTDHTVRMGTVEEWTLVNNSPMDHSLHLHVWPMQLLRTGGREVTEIIRQDVVNLPARSRVTVRVAFDDYPGRTVYHCHILDHEDLGMMGVVEAR